MKRLGVLSLGLALLGLIFPAVTPSLAPDATEEASHHAIEPKRLQDPEVGFDYRLVDVLVDYQGLPEPKTYPCVYSDEAFFGNSSTYSHFLARQSIGLALSAFHLLTDEEDDLSPMTEGTAKGALISYFEDLEFEDVRIDDYLKETSLYTVGSAIGHKTIRRGDEEYELVAVGVRGGNYKNEWQSNLTLDMGVRHRGFDEAATLVTDRILSYLGQNTFTHPVKVWISGYSRAGAITNLVAANLDMSSVLSKEQVYAYTFAAPRPLWRYERLEYDAEFSNIFNIVGASDFIPQFAPEEWHYHHYGVTKMLTGAEFDSTFAAKYAQIQKKLKELGIDTYYNTALNLRIRMLFGMLLEVAHDEFEFMEYLQPTFLKVLQRKGVNNLIQLLRETVLEWSASHPELASKKDAIIDFAIETLRPILFGGDYVQGKECSSKSKPLLIAHEHFPELYLYSMYGFGEAELFNHANQFAYITLNGGKYTLIDTAANQTVMTIDHGTKQLSSFAEENNIDPVLERIRGTLTLILPYDRDYSLNYELASGETLEAYVQPYGNIYTSHLTKYVSSLDASAPRNGNILSLSSGKATYTGTSSLSTPTEFVHHLNIQNGLMPYRVYVFVVGLAVSLILVALMCLLVLVQAKIAKRKVRPLRLVLLSLFLVCIIEGEMSFWFFADIVAFGLVAKGIAALLLLTLYLLGKKPKVFKRPDKTILPFLLLAFAGNLVISVNFAVGLAFITAGIAFMCFRNLRERRMASHQWFLYAVFSVLFLLCAALLLPKNPDTIVFFVLIPVALLYCFSSFDGSGQKEAASFVMLIGLGTLAPYLYGSLPFAMSLLFVFFFNTAMILHIFTYDTDQPGIEASISEPPSDPGTLTKA